MATIDTVSSGIKTQLVPSNYPDKSIIKDIVGIVGKALSNPPIGSEVSVKHSFFDFSEVTDKEQLVTKLYDLYQRIYAGSDYKAFKAPFYDPKTFAAFVHTVQKEDGKLIGYLLIRLYLVTYPKDQASNSNIFAVFRGQAGTLPDYRGNYHQSQGVSMGMTVVAFQQLNPPINITNFGSLLRPESLVLLSKYNPARCFPSPLHQTPPAVEKYMAYLRDYMGVASEESSFYAIKYSVTSLLSDKDRKRYEASLSPYIKHFLDLTKLKPGVGIMGLSIRFLVSNNPLGLEPSDSIAKL